MYREQPGYTAAGATSGPDLSAQLFSEGYVFGEPVQPIEENPGVAIDGTSNTPSLASGPDDTAWVGVAPDQEPTPVASDRPNPGNDGAWYAQWTGLAGPLIINAPNGESIRSLWIPFLQGQIFEDVTPTPLSYVGGGAVGYPALDILGGFGSGILIRRIDLHNQWAPEMIPLPKGLSVVSLVLRDLAAPSTSARIYWSSAASGIGRDVFASSLLYGPGGPGFGGGSQNQGRIGGIF